jgi:hypothetical protein
VAGGGGPYAFYANYAQLWPGGGGTNGYFLGQTTATIGSLAGGTNPFGIQATINNSNISGVIGDSLGCFTSGAPFGPEAVMTGVELAIPLGRVGSPADTVEVGAFINGSGHDFLSNQVLGPIWDGTSFFCQGNLGEPTLVNFSTLPGVHSFVVPAPPCSFSVSPLSASYGYSGGTGSVTVTVGGGCNWTATNNAAFITITAGNAGIGSGSVSYSVATNTSHSGRTGTLTIAGQTFTVTQAAGPLGPIITDGTAEANYGCPIAVQPLGTSFGDSNDGFIDAANGSELDAAYGIVQNGVLFLVLAGNLEANFNKLEIFFQTGPGGQNILTNINPSVDFNGLNRMGYNG